MQNLPTGCMSHLPTILRTFKHHSKSRSVKICCNCSDLDPSSRQTKKIPARAPPSWFSWGFYLFPVSRPQEPSSSTLPHQLLKVVEYESRNDPISCDIEIFAQALPEKVVLDGRTAGHARHDLSDQAFSRISATWSQQSYLSDHSLPLLASDHQSDLVAF